MYLTNHQFVKELAQADTNTVIHKLNIINKLLMKFGKKITHQTVLDVIQKNDESLAHLIKLLHTVGKLDPLTVKDLLNTCKKNYTYQKSFTVSSSDTIDDIDNYIKTNFEAHIDHSQYQKT